MIRVEKMFGKQLLILAACGFAVTGLSYAQEGERPKGERKVVEERVVIVKEIEHEEGDGESGSVIFLQRDGSDPRVFFGPTQRGYLGVTLLPLTDELIRHFVVDESFGVMIAAVDEGGPAHRAGIRVGDIVTRIGDREFGSTSELQHFIARHKGGDSIEVEFWRDGRSQRVSATLIERKQNRFDFSELLNDPVDIEKFAFKLDPRVMAQVQAELAKTLEAGSLQDRIQSWTVHHSELQQRLQELERELERMHRELQRLRQERDR